MTWTAMAFAFFAGVGAHIALDAIWLGVIARGVYKRGLGPLMAPRVRWASAVAFYAVYGLGIVWFAVVPAIAAGVHQNALLHGGLLGLVAYGTYDLTNLATLRDWPLRVTVLDLAWGIAASAASAFAATWAAMTV
jgi:uncharacterized membrane protein